MGFFKKFKEAWLASMTFDRLDDDFYEELEEALILADIGAATAADTVAQLRKRVSQKLLGRADEVKDALRDIGGEAGRGRPVHGPEHPAERGADHRRQRRGKDHVHRQAGRPLQE